MNIKKKIVYISYDGILEPIGESQILPYVYNLADNYNIILITFEKLNNLQNINFKNKIQKKFDKKNIIWHSLTFNKSSLLNIIKGCIFIFYITIFNKINCYHIRSYPPGLLILFYIFLLNKKFIFDMRGFWIDEKVDRLNLNKKSFKYIFFKFIEKNLIKKSFKIVTLTKESKRIIINQYPQINKNKIFTIPTCTDVNKFYPNSYKNKNKNKNKNKIIFCLLGSIDTAYDYNKVINLFKIFIEINDKVFLNIITKSNTKKLNIYIKSCNINKKNYSIKSAKHSNINKIINSIDIGIFYAKKNYSIKGSFPTKIGEFLSCGKPIFCNYFNDDIKNMIIQNNLGIISDFKKNNSLNDYKKIKKIINKNMKNKLRNFAIKNLSLEIAIRDYNKIYEEI